MNKFITNMGSTDKIIRAAVAILLLVLYFTNSLPNEILALIAVGISIIFLLTSAFGYCPMYSILKTSTRNDKKSN